MRCFAAEWAAYAPRRVPDVGWAIDRLQCAWSVNAIKKNPAEPEAAGGHATKAVWRFCRWRC
jgi:hypothetical protein